MKRSPYETTPVWAEFGESGALPMLSGNDSADVCIVGAGIAGLTTAYLLLREGKSVVVVDQFGVAAGETGRTTAHLSAVLDDRFSDLESLFGEEGARLAAESHRAAIDRIEAIVAEEGIDCDFERLNGYLVATDEEQRRIFDKEREAIRRVGFTDAAERDKVRLPHVSLTAPTLEFPRQATFNIARYIAGLAQAVQRSGGRIYGRTHVTAAAGGEDAHVEADSGHRVTAAQIVVATNSPINDRVTMHTKQAAYRSYVVGFEIKKDSYPGFLLWDLADPYHYVRIVRGTDRDWLITGGEDHKTGQARDMAERYDRLEAWTRRYFSQLGPVVHRWSGQIIEPVDSLGFIGRNPADAENVYIATGDSGHGMTHGTIAGILLTDLIQGRANPWAKLYDPARKTLKAATDFVSENVNAAAHLIEDWVAGGEIGSVDEVPRGEGAILRRGLAKIAVYRDMQDRVHERSAVCPHLGCIVQWNPNEKSWDCPCHGSRFDGEGRVLNGPAAQPLGDADPTEPAAEPVAPAAAD